MNKSVAKRKEDREMYDGIFSGKSKAEGLKYISENIPNKKLSRAVMASFIANCGDSADKKWLKETFMVKAYDVKNNEKVYNQKQGKELFLEHFDLTLASHKDQYDEFADLIVEDPTPKAPKASKE